MKYNFDEIVNRRGTYSLKWDGGERIKKNGITERYDAELVTIIYSGHGFTNTATGNRCFT